MNLQLMEYEHKLQSRLGFSDANLGATALNWIEEDEERLRQWILHLERLVRRSGLPSESVDSECDP